MKDYFISIASILYYLWVLTAIYFYPKLFEYSKVDKKYRCLVYFVITVFVLLPVIFSIKDYFISIASIFCFLCILLTIYFYPKLFEYSKIEKEYHGLRHFVPIVYFFGIIYTFITDKGLYDGTLNILMALFQFVLISILLIISCKIFSKILHFIAKITS
jgi:hypothetical protein